MAYDFHYTPTGTGVISGKEVLEQTEDAINDLGNTAISGVQEALDKAEQALTNSENAVDDAQTALNTANNAEGVAIQAQNDVSNLSGTVTNIGNRVTTAEGNISNLQGRMTTAEGNITNLQGRMTTAETNIGNLQTAVSTAQATANSAQQTATTARQQSYVFRYSGTAVVPNSTIAYSTIDNTDNIKSGDKILDVDGKLFEITAVDTTNETVTVGSALIDLAKDSDVVHTSGNETVGGQKTFTNTIKSQKEIEFTGNRLAYILPEFSASYSGLSLCTYGSSGAVKIGSWKVDDNDNTKHVLDTSLGYLNVTTGVVNSVNSVYLTPRNTTDSKLGDSTNKWKEINGLTPSSLSLPGDRSSRVDISGYFTNTANGDTNTYTVPANGWIYLNLNDVVVAHCFAQTAGNLSHYGQTFARASVGQLHCLFPIRKDDVFVSQWYTTTTVTVTNAYFVPCLGNI